MEIAATGTEGDGTERRVLCAGPVTAAHLPIPAIAGDRCPLCGMGFRDAPPPAVATGGATATDVDIGDVELLRCSDCGRSYWTDPHGPGGLCIVGLLPRPEGLR